MTVIARLMMEVEIEYGDTDDETPQECLNSMASLIESLQYQGGCVAGTHFRFGEAGHTVIENLPASMTVVVDGHGALVEKIQEMQREAWQAEIEAAIEPYFKGYVGKMPGEVIAEALRALADRYEML